jgi:SAM-dependent methyltransferase
MDIKISNWVIPPTDHLWLEESCSESYENNYLCDGCGEEMETISEVRNIGGAVGLVTGICPECGYVKRVRNLPPDWYSRHFVEKWLVKRDEQLHKDEYVYNKIKKYVPAGGTVLDLGCGIGQRLLPFHEAGFQAFGVEPSLHRSAIGREKMSNVITGTAEEYLSKTDKIFDAIFIFNVLQFTSNPFHLINLAVRRLSDRGVLFFSVGQFYDDGEYCHFSHLGLLRCFISPFCLKKLLSNYELYLVECSESPFEVVLKNGSSSGSGAKIFPNARKVTKEAFEQFAFGRINKFKMKYIGSSTIRYGGRKISLRKVGKTCQFVPTCFIHDSSKVPVLLK